MESPLFFFFVRLSNGLQPLKLDGLPNGAQNTSPDFIFYFRVKEAFVSLGEIMRDFFEKLFERNSLNRKLHWTTIASEKVILALVGILTVYASLAFIYELVLSRSVELSDLFLLFIYVEIIGMVGAYYSTNRIPVTLPIIIAITALCRLIVMQSKDTDAITLIAEAGAILILSGAAYLMSLKEERSILKQEQRNKDE